MPEEAPADESPQQQPSSDLSRNIRRARYSRAEHRNRQHETAHADEPPAPLPDHVTSNAHIPKTDVGLVTTPDAYQQLLAHLRAAGSFAYDSEFIGELTYVPNLCLVQVATVERVALIDPLVGLDLKPFWELIADP